MDGCYPEQSCAAPFIAQLANLIPGTSGKVRLQSFALESGFPKPETGAPLAFRNNAAKTVFDDGFHGGYVWLSLYG
jgi:hypothetical protein